MICKTLKHYEKQAKNNGTLTTNLYNLADNDTIFCVIQSFQCYLVSFSDNQYILSPLIFKEFAILALPQDRFLCFSSVIQCFLVLFCQPKRTFSCSRVLLFPCNPIVEVVKHVVKNKPCASVFRDTQGYFFIYRTPNFGAQ